jgi:hypothetical protein
LAENKAPHGVFCCPTFVDGSNIGQISNGLYAHFWF